MIRQVTREEALDQLKKGKKVYMMTAREGDVPELADLDYALDQCMISDVEEEAPPSQAPKKEKAKRGRKPIDWGKAHALKEGGWDDEKIADDLGCAVQTITKHFENLKPESNVELPLREG